MKNLILVIHAERDESGDLRLEKNLIAHHYKVSVQMEGDSLEMIRAIVTAMEQDAALANVILTCAASWLKISRQGEEYLEQLLEEIRYRKK